MKVRARNQRDLRDHLTAAELRGLSIGRRKRWPGKPWPGRSEANPAQAPVSQLDWYELDSIEGNQ